MLSIGRWGILIMLLFIVTGCGQRATSQPTGQTAPQSAPKAAAPAPAAPAPEGKEPMAGSAEIAWNYDYADGLAKAKAAGKPIMIDVFATWCGPCKILDEQVFSRADVVAASTAFVTIRIDGDKHPDTVTKLNVSAYPTVLFLNPEGKEIGRSLGAVPYQDMLSSMAAAQKKVGSPK